MTKRPRDATFDAPAYTAYASSSAPYAVVGVGPRQYIPPAAALASLPVLGNQVPTGYNQGAYVAPGAQNTPAQVKKTALIQRRAGGEAWSDPTLAEWDPNDFRLFVGDLGKEVSDSHLTAAFSQYPSFLKARVVRDSKTGKAKGYGFVSFREPDDFTRAFREMNGKFIGTRPIKLRKSTWKERSVVEQVRAEKDRVAGNVSTTDMLRGGRVRGTGGRR